MGEAAKSEGGRRPLLFCAAVLLLSLPLQLWEAAGPDASGPLGLPLSAGLVVLPAALAALFLLGERRLRAAAGARRLGGSGTPAAAALALLGPPLATALACAAVLVATGAPLAAAVPPWTTLLALAALFLFAAALEELGWTAYATPALQARFGVYGAGLLLGLVWAAWHVAPWALIQGHDLRWVAGQAAVSVLARLTMGLLWARGGRSFALAVVFHAGMNLAWASASLAGLPYDPVWTAAGFAALLAAAAALLRGLRPPGPVRI